MFIKVEEPKLFGTIHRREKERNRMREKKERKGRRANIQLSFELVAVGRFEELIESYTMVPRNPVF